MWDIVSRSRTSRSGLLWQISVSKFEAGLALGGYGLYYMTDTLGTIFTRLAQFCSFVWQHFWWKNKHQENVQFRVARQWLKVNNQWLDVAQKFLSLDPTKSMTLTRLWLERVVTQLDCVSTNTIWRGHITAVLSQRVSSDVVSSCKDQDGLPRDSHAPPCEGYLLLKSNVL